MPFAASPSDGLGEITARELVEQLQEIYPDAKGIGGPKSLPPDRNSPRFNQHTPNYSTSTHHDRSAEYGCYDRLRTQETLCIVACCRAKCTRAEIELGLRCHTARDTLKDTIDTLMDFGAIEKIRTRMAEKAAKL